VLATCCLTFDIVVVVVLLLSVVVLLLIATPGKLMMGGNRNPLRTYLASWPYVSVCHSQKGGSRRRRRPIFWLPHGGGSYQELRISLQGNTARYRAMYREIQIDIETRK
jgi:hypothetical protein